MFWKPQHGWIGVDIGTCAIKVAQVVRRAGGLSLADCAIVRRRVPWEDESPNEPHSSASEIRAALSLGRRFRGRRAASTISMALCELLSLDVAEQDVKHQRKLVAREIASRSRESSGAAAFDFWAIASDGPGGGSRGDNVNSLSVSNAWVDQIAEDVTSTGLWCQALDGVPLAVSRAASRAKVAGSGQTIGALDWGYSQATFCVTRRGETRYVRCLRDCGMRNAIDALTGDLGVNEEEAQHLLTSHGLPRRKGGGKDDVVQPLIGEILSPHVRTITAEVERTLEYLRSHRRSAVPQRIALLGGGATIRNLPEVLSESLEMPVGVWEWNSGTKQVSERLPLCLFGPAIALSCLTWET